MPLRLAACGTVPTRFVEHDHEYFVANLFFGSDPSYIDCYMAEPARLHPAVARQDRRKSSIAVLAYDVRDLKGQIVTSLEESFANLQHGIATMAEGQAGIHKRIDRVEF